MQCADVQDELVSFHFATCSQPMREALREHLRACSACAQAYLDLKLDIESAESMAEKPSPRCHARLQRDVQAWLLPPPVAEPPPSRWQRVWQPLALWLRQPLPRYRAAFGVAVVSAASVLILSLLPRSATMPAPAHDDSAAPLPTPVRHLPDGTPLGCDFDSARPQAVSITYY